MLKLKKIFLESLKECDIPVLFKWINDRDLRLFNSYYYPVSEEQHKNWFENIKNKNDLVIFAIRLSRDNKLIGTCQLHTLNWIHRSAELQIRIGEKQYQNSGFGSDALKLLLKFAFHDLNLKRVSLHVFSTNLRAIHFYEKNRFVIEGTLRKSAYVDGTYVDTIIMSILDEEYE